MKILLILIVIVAAFLPGCATTASNTWVCSDGTCAGKGIWITRTGAHPTEVTMDSTVDKAAIDPTHFSSPVVPWSSELSVGIKQIDDQHSKMLYMANALFEAFAKNYGKQILDNIIYGTVAYADKHFADEEQLMLSYGYPDYDAHKQQHAALQKEIADIVKKHESGYVQLNMEVREFFKIWLLNHILGDDKKLGQYLRSKGIH